MQDSPVLSALFRKQVLLKDKQKGRDVESSTRHDLFTRRVDAPEENYALRAGLSLATVYLYDRITE
jgi:hypothetical protein